VAELILALDVPDRDAAFRLLDRLPRVRWVKVGPVLFTRAGPELIAELKRRDLRVFLDLKWHDIPNTVQGAVAQARDAGVDMVTVHALGGGAMVAAARRAAASQVAVVAVTVLTSHSAGDLGLILGRANVEAEAEVVRLARLARGAGADGVVSSPLEAAALRSALGAEALLVTPGIRLPSDPPGDQTRTATAAEAARWGSTHLVVGRPVLQAPDPVASWIALLESIR
jgi:orotidine-5'-phosphate decarboxylase